jgi:hypothetical protein
MCYLCQENAVRSVHRLCQTLLFLSDLPVKKTSPNSQDDVRGAHHRRSDRLHAAAQDRAPRRPEFENVTAMRNTYGDHPHPVDASTFATVPRSLEKKRRRLDVRAQVRGSTVSQWLQPTEFSVRRSTSRAAGRRVTAACRPCRRGGRPAGEAVTAVWSCAWCGGRARRRPAVASESDQSIQLQVGTELSINTGGRAGRRRCLALSTARQVGLPPVDVHEATNRPEYFVSTCGAAA